MAPSKHILPVIIIAQFLCTSLWFAGNGVMNELIQNFNLSENALGNLTSAVQFGFITGTFIFALLSIADRFAPSKVFFTCAMLGAIFNACMIWNGNTIFSLLLFRFCTGFFLAGIYPVGMKIAADYFDKGLGQSLGFLVGALVMGTALPHLLKDFISDFPWKYVLIIISLIAITGGVLLFALVPDGPFRKASQKIKLSAFLSVFQNKDLRSAAFGYFGHMWELYAFWTFVPIILKLNASPALNIPLFSFIIIGSGGIACVISALLAKKYGTKKIASFALGLSFLCCLVSPILLNTASDILLIVFLLFWGMVVIADSPLFSTLVANNAPLEIKGTALTIVNCIGFAITIISIQLLGFLNTNTPSNYIYWILAIGPFLGLLALRKKQKSAPTY